MAEFRGNLYIFVDAIHDAELAPSAAETGNVFGLLRPGEMMWYLSGWAVGKSVRSQYCARTSTSKLRNFATCAQAMDFARQKRKNRPTENFHLVYEVDGRKSIVTSLEQIQARDKGPVHQKAVNDGPAHRELETLARKVGKIVATNALELLRTLAQEGEAAAKERFSAATYERLWQVLREATLLPPEMA